MTRELSPHSRRPVRRDERFDALKRRVVALARLGGEPITLAEGVFLAEIQRVTDPKTLVSHLSRRGVLTRAELEKGVRLAGPLVAVDARTVASAHHDLRALEAPPAALALKEHRRALGRLGRIDAAWLEERRERVEVLRARLKSAGAEPRAKEAWFTSVIELVRAARGAREAELVADTEGKVRARPAERRAEASARLDAVVRALETDEPPADSELADHASRLDAALDLPGRARRRRVLEVLRRIVGWPSATLDLVVGANAQSLAREAYAVLLREIGRKMIRALPAARDRASEEQALERIAELALAFAIGEGGLPVPDDTETAALGERAAEMFDLAGAGLDLATALALWRIPMKRGDRKSIARWVKEGLDVDLVALAAKGDHTAGLARVPDVRAARAYATWATRLSAHYAAQNVTFSLSPELFANLPRNEDLAVLAMCLMEHVDAKTKSDTANSDPIAVLDATLALFQHLPTKARGLLSQLRKSPAGEGRRLFPEFGAWIDDDALLDRCVHVAKLAGEPPLTRAIREDFEHAERALGERRHLERLEHRSAPQQGRLDALLRVERTLAGSPRTRTLRRLEERIERLFPVAYRRELDVTFREILDEAWGIAVPSLTPAWRDAVRYWLVVDSNKEHLGRLLRAAAKAPGVAVGNTFRANETWLTAAKSKIDVDAWLAPRKRIFEVDGARFVLELEEDPLEILRMGIPFGTCLSLEGGMNAASTVLNALDANKRVLYVRNAAGSVVARKLLAISKDFELIGYNLYVAPSGKVALAIRGAVREACRALAHDVGAPLSVRGEPAKIHQGFWYDDGIVAFDEDVDVAEYCSALGLEAPGKPDSGLADEARAWRLCETGDADGALALLAVSTSPANTALGAWVVDRLGARAAEKRVAEDSSVFAPLARSLLATAPSEEEGVVHVLEVAGRLPDGWSSHHRLPHFLARFPPSRRVASAIAEVAVRVSRRAPKLSDHGLCHQSLTELPAMFADVASALDCLDTVEPAWDRLGSAVPGCTGCIRDAIERATAAVEAMFTRTPDPDTVAGALMSRHRGRLAQHAALRVAARHVLPNGARAVARLAALRPDLVATPDGVAAFVRQERADEITERVARRAPRAKVSSFEALRDLVLACGGLERLLPDSGRVVDLGTWEPGPWELAWRRRHRDDELVEQLFDEAARVPRKPSRALDRLALLGELERIGALDHVVAPPSSRRAPRPRAQAKELPKGVLHSEPGAARRTATSLAAQVRAEQRGELDPECTLLYVDAGYGELARRLLTATTDETTLGLARAIVLADSRSALAWTSVLAAAVDSRDDATAARILEGKLVAGAALPPRLVVDVWQRDELRPALAAMLARVQASAWLPRVSAADRDAHARGLSVDGLLEAVALALVAHGDHDDAVEVDTLDELRAVAAVLVNDAAPVDVAKAYSETADALSAAAFLRAIQRQPLDRAAAIRDAGKKELGEAAPGDKDHVLAGWLESTRKRPHGSHRSV